MRKAVRALREALWTELERLGASDIADVRLSSHPGLAFEVAGQRKRFPYTGTACCESRQHVEDYKRSLRRLVRETREAA
jgi:hypothetical protein